MLRIKWAAGVALVTCGIGPVSGGSAQDDGPYLVHDFENVQEGSSHPEKLTVHGGKLFFIATESHVGQEIWSSDGTESGTTLLKDTAPGNSPYGPTNVDSVGDAIYYSSAGNV